jgi:large subunit ribosomal protein L18
MFNQEIKNRINRIKRHRRVRAKISGDGLRPRLSVYKSNKGYFLQLINDEIGKTLITVHSSNDVEEIKKLKLDQDTIKKNGLTGKKLIGFQSGALLAKKASDKKIKSCVFDGSGFRYHGRIKAVAEGARLGGLKF